MLYTARCRLQLKWIFYAVPSDWCNFKCKEVTVQFLAVKSVNWHVYCGFCLLLVGVLRQYALYVKSVCNIYTPRNMKLRGYLAPKPYTRLSHSFDLYLICSSGRMKPPAFSDEVCGFIRKIVIKIRLFMHCKVVPITRQSKKTQILMVQFTHGPWVLHFKMHNSFW